MLYELSVVVSQSHVFTLTFFNPEFPWPSNSVSFRKIFLFHINSVEVDTCPLGNFQIIKIIFTSILIFFSLISFHFIYLNSPAKIIQTCFAQHFLAINRLKIRQWSQLAKAQSLGVCGLYHLGVDLYALWPSHWDSITWQSISQNGSLSLNHAWLYKQYSYLGT